MTTIRIVISGNYPALTAAFDDLAAIEADLQNPNVNSPLPSWNGVTYSRFVTEATNWMTKNYPSGAFPDQVTDRQVFGIFVYTTDYFHPIQNALVKTKPNFPIGKDGIGFTDLTNTDYQNLIPLYAAISSGLMNIRAFHGTTYRGSDNNWNPFTPKTTVRSLNYVSSALQYPDGKKLPWPYPTPAPWNNTSHMRLQSLSARDIAPYSKHGYETEHLFDHGVVFYITSNITSNQAGHSIVIGNEVPATLSSLL